MASKDCANFVYFNEITDTFPLWWIFFFSKTFFTLLRRISAFSAKASSFLQKVPVEKILCANIHATQMKRVPGDNEISLFAGHGSNTDWKTQCFERGLVYFLFIFPFKFTQCESFYSKTTPVSLFVNFCDPPLL